MGKNKAAIRAFIASVIGLSGSEPRNGDGYISVCCPLHDDDHASASISFDKWHFNCFGVCGGMSITALYKELTETMDEQGEDEMELEYSQVEDVSGFFDGEPVVSTSVTLIDADILTQYAKEFVASRKISKEVFLEAKPELISTPGNPLYGYIKFTHDTHPNHYVARNVIPNSGQPRYKNSPGSKNFYGLSKLEKGDVIVVEGMFDYLTLCQLGFRNVIPTLGTKFNGQHAYALRGRTVFILFDNDYDGFSSSRKAAEIFKTVEANPIVLEMPFRFGKDTNEALQNDLGEELREWLQNEIEQYDSFDTKYIKNTFIFDAKPLKMYPTGIASYDNYLGGGFKEGTHVITAEPGVGKSSLCIWSTASMAEISLARVLYCTYEISKRQIWARVASMKDRLAWPEIELDPMSITQASKERLVKMAANYRVVAGWNIQQIERAIHSFDVCVIDYIQRMPMDTADVRVGVSKNIQRLSDIARDEGKIIIAVSSLSRSGYDKDSMSGLKESGDIEFVVQSCMKMSSAGVGNTAVVTMLKNTRGMKGRFWLDTNLGHTQFREANPIEETDDTNAEIAAIRNQMGRAVNE